MLRNVTLMAHVALAVIAAAATTAHAQLDLGLPPGVGGSAGPFSPTSNTTVNLAEAPDGAWNQPGTSVGVYDPQQWAVVYHYSEVNIPAGVTVSFANHPADAPVIWIVDGDVTIAGTLSLNGGGGVCNGQPPFFAQGGPGGFRGGVPSESAVQAMVGLGPGGGTIGDGDSGGGGGSYATSGGGGACGGGSAGPVYGSPFIVPLIGGSGGGGGSNASIGTGAGGGGGAILIVAKGQFINNGLIRANGGNSCNIDNGREGGGGSGGAIRIVANIVAGSGFFQALGGSGGDSDSNSCPGGNGGLGRIRIEGNSVNLSSSGEPAYSLGVPATPALIVPPSNAPIVRVISIAGEVAPSDPEGDLTFPNADIEFDSETTAPVVIETVNVPTDSIVRVRVAPRTGQAYFVDAVLIGGNTKLATWQADVDFANGFGAIQVRAIFPTPEG